MSYKALYINIPFCVKPCSFCHYTDNVYFGFNEIPEKYFNVLLMQLNKLKNIKFKSVYFGGGTPSLLSDKQLDIIRGLIENNKLNSDEISIELHPAFINFNYKHNDFFTRYSVGAQAFSKNILKTYGREDYDFNNIEQIVNNLRDLQSKPVINIDLIFDDNIIFSERDKNNILKLMPDNLAIYPNTKGRGASRLIYILKTLNEFKNFLNKFYDTLGKSKHIFIRKACKCSEYAKIQNETFGDIIGIGHNSVSYIGDESFLTLYDTAKEEIKILKRVNKGGRYLAGVLSSAAWGVRFDYANKFLKEAVSSNYFRSVEDDIDINSKHARKLNDDELIYMPDSEFIRFYLNILSGRKYETVYYNKLFLSEIGFGDSDYGTLEYVYNNINFLNQDASIIKNSPPDRFILIEGIDGSGKDTFADLLVLELKKRFKYDINAPISVTGQPDSSLIYGRSAKSFIEDLKFKTQEEAANALIENMLQSEEKILRLGGIVILIRGMLTSLATYNYAFHEELNIKSKINWDYLIVIDVEPEEAFKRIIKRGDKLTWRENIDCMKYFSEFFKLYNSNLFNKKILIRNDDINDLKIYAEKIADELI
ncbi:MAG: hypothetical protein IJR21_09565 [Synergistaceae bacterium]|nr:hypothetical protein [Synergistaceae bacterium]